MMMTIMMMTMMEEADKEEDEEDEEEDHTCDFGSSEMQKTSCYPSHPTYPCPEHLSRATRRTGY